jgi:Sulfatase
MIKFIRTQPIYLLLLPMFFVLHGLLENFGFISYKDAAILCLSYFGLTLLIAVFSWFVFRNRTKASLITVTWMGFFFFFAALHEFLKEHGGFLIMSRYSVLLSIFFIVFVILFVWLKKVEKPFFRSTMYLNVLLLIYIVVDTTGVIIKSVNPAEHRLSTYGFAKKNQYYICDTCAKPYIYFLLMDEYASSLSLKEQYNYDNNLDTFLQQKGFSIQVHSRSNYNFTPFSMSATLNMSFIAGIEDVKAVSAEDYANCNLLIRDNEAIKFLDAQGYDIINYSVFDLAGHPAMVDQSFLPLKTKLITDRTFFARLNKDIGWLIMTWYPFKFFKKNFLLQHRENNADFKNRIEQESMVKSPKPRFTYAHFYMPHPPFYYYKDGRPKDNATVYQEFKFSTPDQYLDYVTYVNTQIKEMVSRLQERNPSAVIILLSDHGYRPKTTDPYPLYYFQNMNAVYYPDKDYSLLYDSITNVNELRVVFNKVFKQTYPLLKDTSILLKDQH